MIVIIIIIIIIISIMMMIIIIITIIIGWNVLKTNAKNIRQMKFYPNPYNTNVNSFKITDLKQR